MMRLPTLAIVLVMPLLLVSSTLFAQEPSAGRRTDFEYVEAGFDLYGFGEVNFPGSDYWNTPEGRQRYLENRMKRFKEDVEEFGELGRVDWVALYGTSSDRATLKELEDRSEDLKDVTEEMIKFLEWAYAAPPLEAESISELSVVDRLAEIPVLVKQTLPTVSAIDVEAVLDVQTFTGMREDLARIYALTQSLGD